MRGPVQSRLRVQFINICSKQTPASKTRERLNWHRFPREQNAIMKAVCDKINKVKRVTLTG